MSPAKRPTAAELMTGKARPAPRVRSDETIGRQEDIGRLVAQPETPNPYLDADRRNARPPKPVRITVDLSPGEHLALRRYATEHGTTGTRVIRALLAELADGGPDLDARVSARLRAAKQ